jgi:hypothetical protein
MEEKDLKKATLNSENRMLDDAITNWGAINNESIVKLHYDEIIGLMKDYVNQRVVEELEELKEKFIYYQEQVRCSIALATIFGDIDDRINQLKK